MLEEGWRYRNNFNIHFRSDELDNKEDIVDVSHIHELLYATGEAASDSAYSFNLVGAKIDNKREVKVTALFRFTPILIENKKIKLGESKTLSDAIFSSDPKVSQTLPSYETVFISGLNTSTSGQIFNYLTPISLHVEDKKEKFDSFKLFPPYNPVLERDKYFKNPVSPPLRIMQRAYIDPETLERNIRFRYPYDSSDTCFRGGTNYDTLYRVHHQALQYLEARKIRIEEEIPTIGDLLLKHDVKEVIDYVEGVAKLTSLTQVNNIVDANSYSCAEQAAMDFLQDKRVISYLMKVLKSEDPTVKGILINIHCRKTPCSTCATSIARESEEGGVFKRISANKPVGVLVSCSKYHRRAKNALIKYANTFWLAGGIELPYDLNLDDSAAFSPIPIVLLSSNSFALNTYKYNHIVTQLELESELETEDLT